MEDGGGSADIYVSREFIVAIAYTLPSQAEKMYIEANNFALRYSHSIK